MAARRSNRTRSGSTGPVQLAPELRMNGADELRAQLLAALDAGAPVDIDGSAVASADAAALQVLYVFAAEARQQEQAWTWSGVSAPLREACVLLGIDSKLELPAQPAV